MTEETEDERLLQAVEDCRAQILEQDKSRLYIKSKKE